MTDPGHPPPAGDPNHPGWGYLAPGPPADATPASAPPAPPPGPFAGPPPQPPAPGPPGYGPPGYSPPGYSPPGYSPPGYSPPGYSPPGYGPPGYGPPGYGPPPPPGYGPGPATPPYPYGPPPGYGAPPGYGGAPLAKGGNAATGPLPLHPMTVSDVLDGIFKLLKANFRTIAVIVATLVVPVQLAVAFSERNLLHGQSLIKALNDPSVARSSSTPLLPYVGLAANYLLLPYVGAAIAQVASASYLGRQIGPKEALLGVWHKSGTLFAAWVVHVGAELVGVLACGVGIVFVFPLFMMLAPVIVLEGLPFWQAARRSWRLATRRYWPTLGTALLAGLVAYLLGQILGGVPSVAALLIGLHWGWLLLGVGSSLAALIVTPVAGLTATLLYFDARIRTEGLDLQVIAADLARSGG